METAVRENVEQVRERVVAILRSGQSKTKPQFSVTGIDFNL